MSKKPEGIGGIRPSKPYIISQTKLKETIARCLSAVEGEDARLCGTALAGAIAVVAFTTGIPKTLAISATLQSIEQAWRDMEEARDARQREKGSE